jgi:N-acetylglucosamine-6-phosphate deacetylase
MESIYRALSNATIFTGNETLTGKTILIRDDQIEAIADNGSLHPAAEIIDCRGYFISAGSIDLQIAGAGGYLFSANPSEKALNAIEEAIIHTGTTSFLIVLPTNTPDVYLKSIRAIKANSHPAVLGLHLEGPFISQVKKGAHMTGYIKRPDKKEIESLLEEAGGIIKMVTLAPEICTPDIIGLFTKNDIVVCAGHSNATFSEAINGFKWGIRSATHLFNAMSPFHHRDPGLPGATLQTEGIYASIVVDGIHVDFNTVSIAKKILKERLYLISDAVEESNHGPYQHVRQKDRFTLPDGTLSGSLLTMMKAVQNCVENVGIPTDESLRMASLYPARLMNLTDRGRIEPGFKADLVVFDKDFDVMYVMKDGVIQNIHVKEDFKSREG